MATTTQAIDLDQAPTFKAFSRNNFRSLPGVDALGEERLHEIDVVARVFPFRFNAHLAKQVIRWDDPEDPILRLTFPQRGMLSDEDYARMEAVIERDDPAEIKATITEIRSKLNPNPASQKSNVPTLADGTELPGLQHKYKTTVLFFPSQGQTCHSYCTFCFRWSQFVGEAGWRFATKEADSLSQYVVEHPEVEEILFTGGDPMTMKTPVFASYVDRLIENNPGNLHTIRIGTKAPVYWPYRFTTDPDADDLMRCFEKIVDAGLHLSVMLHCNHPNELEPKAVHEAIRRIRATGAQVRSQSPVMQGINDSADTWAHMWKEQIKLGVVPYYMFVARDTGAKRYFEMPLARCYEIFRDAVQQVPGLGRTVRGPSMSCGYGKVEVLGVTEVGGEKAFVLRMLQARDPSKTHMPFFAKFDEEATWISDLEGFGGKDPLSQIGVDWPRDML